jgi:hypothetical protein
MYEINLYAYFLITFVHKSVSILLAETTVDSVRSNALEIVSLISMSNPAIALEICNTGILSSLVILLSRYHESNGAYSSYNKDANFALNLLSNIAAFSRESCDRIIRESIIEVLTPLLNLQAYSSINAIKIAASSVILIFQVASNATSVDHVCEILLTTLCMPALLSILSLNFTPDEASSLIRMKMTSDIIKLIKLLLVNSNTMRLNFTEYDGIIETLKLIDSVNLQVVFC